jgi:signal transduction histidine kinase/CheY-like chemotaxis protein
MFPNRKAATQPTRDLTVDSARVDRERLNKMVGNIGKPFVISAISLVAVAWLTYELEGFWWSFGPVAIVLALHTERWFHILRYRRSHTDRNFDSSKWLKKFLSRLALTGFAMAVWATPLLQLRTDTALLYVFALIVFWAAGSLSQYYIFPKALVVFLTPMMWISALQLLWQGGSTAISVGVLMLLLWASLLRASAEFSANSVREIEQRFQNEALLKEVSEQKDKALLANAAKTRFLAAAGHDLRQPAHAIALLSSSLQARAATPEDAELHARLQGSVTHFGDVVDEVLDLARLDSGGWRVEADATSLGRLFDRVNATYRELASAKGLGLFMRLPKDPVWVHTDTAILWRIISNLVANAVRYTQQGNIIVCVRRGQLAGSPAWRIEVRDSGPGIAPEHQTLIFEEFYQVDNPQRSHSQGLGMGLSVAQRMAALLGLQVKVRSAMDAGSVFSLTLPTASDPNPAVTSAQTQVSPEPLALSVCEVLVIDDDEASRASLGHLLSTWGARVSLAGDADQAGRLCRQMLAEGRTIDLLFTDHWVTQTERSDDVVRAVMRSLATRPGFRAPHVAVITGDTSPTTKVEVQERGWFYAAKPLRPAELHAWMDATLRARLLSQTIEAHVVNSPT